MKDLMIINAQAALILLFILVYYEKGLIFKFKH